jgi:hypothetical protein
MWTLTTAFYSTADPDAQHCCQQFNFPVLIQNNSLFSSHFGPRARDATLNYLQKFSKELRTLTVKSKKVPSQEEMDSVVQFAAKLPKLVRLDVPGGEIRDKNLFRALLRLEHLQHLDMGVEDQALVQEFDKIFPSILTFRLVLVCFCGLEFGRQLEYLVSWFPGIQSLTILTISLYQNDAGLLALAEGLPHLRILHMLPEKFYPLLSPGGILRFAELRGRDLLELSLPFPRDFTPNHFQDLLAFCPNLLATSFCFKKQHPNPPAILSSPVDFVLPQTKMKTVTMINMPNDWVGPFTRSIAANVQTLSLIESVGLTFDQIREAVTECSSLEELRLHLCCCAQDLAMNSEGQAAVSSGGGGGQNVKHLSLQFCQKVDPEAKSMARKVLELCPGVRRVELREGRKVYPVALLLDRLPRLEELEVYKCSLVSTVVPSELKTTSGAFPYLSSILFQGCMNVSDRLLAVMAELSPRLSQLCVGCDWLEGPTTGECVPTFSGLRRLLGRVES